MPTDKIQEAVAEFNKYRSPEATAKLLGVQEKDFVISFMGSFCQSCGFYDYFDDYAIALEDIGLKAAIKRIKEIPDGAEVTFSLGASE